MKRFVIAGMLAMAAGCGGSESKTGIVASSDGIIGKTMIVHSAKPEEHEGRVLITDPTPDGTPKTIFPTFVDSFRAVVLEEMPRVDLAPNDWISPRWKLRVEDGEAKGLTVAVRKESVKLTPLK